MGPDGNARTHAPPERAEASAAQGGEPQGRSPNWQPSVEQILAAVPHPIFWKDCDGVYRGCNDAFARDAGLSSAAEVVGKTDFELWLPRNVAEAYRAADREIIESRQPRRRIVEPLPAVDGIQLWVETTKVPLLTTDGQPYGVLGYYEDITERKQAEEAARQERHFSESTVEAMPGVFFMFDEHGRFVKWNQNLETLSGYTGDELTQRSIFDLLRPDCWELVKQRMQEVFSKGSAVAEVVLVSKDGRETPFYCRSRRMMLAGQPYVLGMGIDISERKRAEAELERTRLLLEAVVEQSPVPMTVVHAPERRLGLTNRAAREFLGKTDEPEFSGMTLEEGHQWQTWRDIRRDGTLTPLEELPLVRTLRGETFTNVEYGVVRKDGTRRWASVSGTPVYDRHGAMIAGLIVYPDITERKAAEEQLRRREAEFRRQNEVLLQLMLRGTLYGGELSTALAEITAAGAELLQTERVSVWWYEDEYRLLRCVDTYQRSSGQHTSGETLRSADFPAYNASHLAGQVIAAPDVRTDPRTCELPAAYWEAHGVRSLVDAPVWLHGRLGAVVCCEHVGAVRPWSPDDERVATLLATLVSLCAESAERRRGEVALRKNEGVLRSMLDATPVGVGLLFGRVMQQVNGALCTITGHTREELIGQDTRMLYPTADEYERVGRVLYDQMRATGLGVCEAQLKRKDGAAVDVMLCLSPFDREDPAAGVTTTMLDITERKRAEQALRASEATLQGIFRAVPTVIGIIAADRTMSFVNDQMQQFLGYTPAEVQGRSACMLYVSEEEFLRVGRDLYQDLWDKGPTQTEGRMRHKNGAEVCVLLNAAPLRPDDPSAGSVVALLDITARKRAEEQLRASEARFRSLYTNMAEGVALHEVVRNEQGVPVNYRLLDVNPNHAQLTGLPLERVVGRLAHEAYGTPEPPYLREFTGVLDAHEPTYLETYFAPMGKHFAISVAPLEADRFATIFFDITERKQAEEQQRRREAELRRQGEVLLQLMMRGTLFGGALDTALAEITAAGAELLQTERVSVWWYEDEQRVIRCADAYQRSSGQHAAGETLCSADFPTYTASHREGQVIAAVDVRTDPRTREIPAAYWDAHDICSLVDAPVWLHGRLGALLSFEQVGAARQWSSDDERVASTLATLVSLCVESAERRRSEAALRENEATYRALFEAAGDAAFVLRVDGDDARVAEANQRALELFGATRAQFQDMAISDLSVPVQADGVPSRVAAAGRVARALQGEPLNFEWRHRRLDGTEFDADVVLACVPLGAERRLLGVIRDITRRKQAEAALVARERLLDSIVEQNAYPMWISDAHGTLVRINRANCELLGITAEDAVNQYNVLQDVMVREQGLTPLVEAVYAAGQTAHFTLEYDLNRWEFGRHGPARQLTLEVTIAPVKDTQGVITNAVTMLKDVTERAQAENELRESERKYRALYQEFKTILEAIPGSLVLISPEMKIVWANEYTKNTSLGFEPREMFGQYCYRCRHDLSEPCEACPVQRCFASGKLESGERDTPNGKIWELYAAPVRGDQGEVKGVIEVAYDVTDYRQAERALKASEARLRSLVQAAPIGIIFSQERTTASVNDALCELLGYSEAELLGKTSRLVYFTQEEYEEVGRRLYGATPTGGHAGFECRFRRKDGTALHVLLTGAPLRPEEPDAGFVLTVQDITQRRRAEEELQKLAAVVRHSSELVNLATFDGRMVFVNDAGVRMLGIDPETVAQHHVLDVIAEQWRPTAERELMPALMAGQTWEGELQYQNLQTGHLTDVHATTFTIDDPATGRPAYFVNVSRDITERKRTQMELLREKQLTEKLLESLPGIFFLYDSTCHLKRWNKAHETVTGFTAEELRDWYIPDWHETPEEAALGMAFVKQVLETGVAGSFETTLINKQGCFVPYLISITRLMTSDGPFMMGVGIDITERKRAEQTLRENEERYRVVAEKTGQLIFDYNIIDGSIRWYGAITPITGHAPDEFQRVNIDAWADLVHPDDRAARRQALETSLRDCGLCDVSYRVRRKDGAYIDVEEHGVVLPGADGRARRMLGTLSDVTARKRAEAAIRSAAREWRTTFDAVNDVVWLLDGESRIVRSNRAAAALFGRDLAELLGRPYWEVVHGTSAPIADCPVVRMRASRSRETLELRLGERWHVVTVDPILDDAGHPTGAVYIVSDITQRKNAELALQSRIVAMTRPLDDTATLTFSDLFDVEEIQKIQDAFTESSGVAQLITDPDGNPITRPSGFCRLCAEFVRQSEKGRQRCALSDATLGRECVHGPVVRPCLSAGLWGAGASITVGGKHIANWLIGQVRDESLDLERIVEYARHVDADPEEFRRALLEVPVMSETQFRKVADTLHVLSNQLSIKAYQNVQQARFIADLKRTEEERDRLFNSSIDMLCVAGFDGRFKQVNPACTRTLGWSAAELKQPEWLEFVHPDDLPATVAAGERLRQGLEVRALENRYRCKDGSYRWLSWNSYPLMEQQLIFGVCRDITERKAAEEERAKLEVQLRQSQKMEAVGQLAGGVAHDFNNILTAVFGQLDLAVQALETQYPTARNLLDGMHQIERSAHRASALTRQLLAFSRRQVTRPEVLNLNTTVRDLEKMLRRLLTENITFDQILAPDLLQTKADAGQLEQVIMNLVVNARDAMPNGGRLALETQNVVLDEAYVALHPGAQTGAHVVLDVSDTGQGMDAATLERIFEPFFTTKPKGQGTGLGLSTVYGIVKQTAGHITVYSEPGRGSTFKVYLPAVHEALPTAKPTRAEAAPPGGTETLIICEDDAAVRDLTARMLTGAGYNVLVAPDAAQALELAAQHAGPLALLITDVIMPDMNGRKLAEALTGVRPDIRTLFVSGYTSNVIAHHGVLDKGVDFLEKPYSRRQLLLKVREVLDRPAPAPGAKQSGGPRRSG